MIRPPAIAPTFAAALAALLACGKSSSPPAQAGAGAAPPPGVPAAPTGPGPAFVSAVTTLRREPSDAARVPGPGKKEVANVTTVLLRGERVTVLDSREDWARVRSSGDTEGWLKRTALLEGEGITEATVLVPADVFDRPDLLAANAKRKVEPATLLLVVKAKPPFSEVNVSSGPNAWVLTERLATGEREVSVAKLAEKARWLKRSGKEDEAKQILALARQSFPDAPLVDVLAADLGEAPPAPPAAQPSTPAATAPLDPTKP